MPDLQSRLSEIRERLDEATYVPNKTTANSPVIPDSCRGASMKVPKRVWVCRDFKGDSAIARSRESFEKDLCITHRGWKDSVCLSCPGPVMFERGAK